MKENWGKLFSGWNLFIAVILSLFFITLVFAEIPIYCPKCKKHLYNYQHDEIIKGSLVKAEDFKPANDSITQPQAGSRMICPLDNTSLNGWQYYADRENFKTFSFAYNAVSLLTKDKDGKWVWVPYDVPQLNMNEVK